GNAISQDSLTSPVLNYFNTESDRKTVIGEKSLAITDKIKFNRKVSQTIISTPYVKLQDGYYRLSAMIRNSGSFDTMMMYAKSKGKTFRYTFTGENNEWKKISLSHIKVRKGKLEIGFDAAGAAGAVWLVDDVELVRE
ncbi:MAG TPA: beta-xylosidase, partial [Chitinophagaceae bacterium]|nr:beta-xylosidase [Chitinophagaceae bacterium]